VIKCYERDKNMWRKWNQMNVYQNKEDYEIDKEYEKQTK
jgi:hypothetical protein